jgi:hypothetical protein
MPLLTPPNVAIVSARIARFAALSTDDQLRAAALVLKRDFGVASPSLRLTATALDTERALIAYSTASVAANATASIDARWLNAVADGTIYWIADDANNAFLLSDLGAANIEQWRAGNDAPSALVALIGERARLKQAARVIIVESSANASGVADDSLAHWRASLGAHIERGALPGVARAVSLAAVPSVQAAQPRTTMDSALLACACVSVLCAALALWRFAASTTSDTPPTTASVAALPAGELWARTMAAAPKLNESMRSANYGGGAWIIAAPKLPRDAMGSIESSLTSNALASQAVFEPEVRIRVQRP